MVVVVVVVVEVDVRRGRGGSTGGVVDIVMMFEGWYIGWLKTGVWRRRVEGGIEVVAAS